MNGVDRRDYGHEGGYDYQVGMGKQHGGGLMERREEVQSRQKRGVSSVGGSICRAPVVIGTSLKWYLPCHSVRRLGMTSRSTALLTGRG